MGTMFKPNLGQPTTLTQERTAKPKKECRPLHLLLAQGASVDGGVFVEGQDTAGHPRHGSNARPPKLTLVRDEMCVF